MFGHWRDSSTPGRQAAGFGPVSADSSGPWRGTAPPPAPPMSLASRVVARRRRAERQNSDTTFVEIRSMRDMGPVRRAWQHLAADALEPNIFFEPSFLEMAALHLPAGRDLCFLLVWLGDATQTLEDRLDIDPADTTLIGLFPVLWPHRQMLPGALHIWDHPLIASGVPLVDKDHADKALARVLGWLAGRRQASRGLRFSKIDPDGPFAAMLERVGQSGGRYIDHGVPRPIALISREHAAEPDGPAEIPAMDGAPIRFERVYEPRAVRDAVELFLTLDADGRTDGTQSCLLDDAATTAFIRSVTRALARDRRCRIDIARIEGRPAAASIIIETADRSWIWQTGHSNQFGDNRPLEALLADTIRRQLERTGIVATHAASGIMTPFAQAARITDMFIACRPGLSPTARLTGLRGHLGRKILRFARDRKSRPSLPAQ